MKLIRFGAFKREKPGVLIDGVRHDCSGHFQDWNADFFQSGGLETLRSLCAAATCSHR